MNAKKERFKKEQKALLQELKAFQETGIKDFPFLKHKIKNIETDVNKSLRNCSAHRLMFF